MCSAYFQILVPGKETRMCSTVFSEIEKVLFVPHFREPFGTSGRCDIRNVLNI
jgi:hypothetical protein